MTDTVMAISIQRRCVAVAVFSHMKLERMEVRHLSYDMLRAATTVHQLITRLLAAYPAERATVEAIPGPTTARRAELARLAHQTFADRGIPVTSVSTDTLLRAFSLPRCRTRKALREIVSDCWPALFSRFGTSTVLDAAALGLYVQIQSYFDQ